MLSQNEKYLPNTRRSPAPVDQFSTPIDHHIFGILREAIIGKCYEAIYLASPSPKYDSRQWPLSLRVRLNGTVHAKQAFFR